MSYCGSRKGFPKEHHNLSILHFVNISLLSERESGGYKKLESQ